MKSAYSEGIGKDYCGHLHGSGGSVPAEGINLCDAVRLAERETFNRSKRRERREALCDDRDGRPEKRSGLESFHAFK